MVNPTATVTVNALNPRALDEVSENTPDMSVSSANKTKGIVARIFKELSEMGMFAGGVCIITGLIMLASPVAPVGLILIAVGTAVAAKSAAVRTISSDVVKGLQEEQDRAQTASRVPDGTDTDTDTDEAIGITQRRADGTDSEDASPTPTSGSTPKVPPGFEDVPVIIPVMLPPGVHAYLGQDNESN